MSAPSPIPFVRAFDFAYGRADAVSPLIRRVVAENPGPFTFTGTGTYIVGQGEVAVIDPGPADERHLQALLAALGSERVSHILVTHTHADHSPLARPLARATGAPVLAAAPPAQTLADGGAEEGDDRTFTPDHILADGEGVTGPGWTLKTVATPGHASNHLAFWLEEERALFTGDHVMGWSTTVVIPPDGDMDAYLASLDRVMALNADILWPTHGPPVTRPGPFLEAYRAHRYGREAQILDALAAGPARIETLVADLYAAVDRRLWPAAGLSVLAHLIRLERAGRVTVEGSPDLTGLWQRG